MSSTNHALIIYPVVGLLGLAALVPLTMSSPAVASGSASVDPRSSSPRVVVSSSAAPRQLVSVVPSIADRPAPVAPPAGADDRWWRAQLERLGTMSVVHFPDPPPPKPAPVPMLERVQREAAARAQAAAADAAGVSAAPPAPPITSQGDARLGVQVPAAIKRWEPLILRAGRKHDLDPNLIAALMQTESGGDPKAVSPMNAIGLLQVLNGPPDPETNIDQGAQMLAGHLKRFGSLNLALAAYNAGPNAVLQYGGIPPYQETYNHVTRTLASYAAFRA